MINALKFKIRGKNDTDAAFNRVKKNLRGVNGVMATVQARAKRLGRSMRNIGAGMTVGVTAPIALLGKQSLALFQVQEEAEAAVRQVVKSTGMAAGKTAEELFRIASGLQKITAVGDEDILRNLTVPLATFTKISGPQFERSQELILDLSRAMKMDLKSSAVQVGKALNDPATGLSMLTRVGITFSDDQKKVIKALQETGKMAEAQGLILDALETKYGGQAAAYADTTSGMIDDLKNAIGDLKEELGAQIVPFLKPLVEQVRAGVEWFGKLSPAVKKNIVVWGGLAAVAGPALSILGLGVLAITPLIGILGAVLSPIGLVVAATVGLGVAAYKNWDKIKEAYPGIANAIEVSFDVAVKAGSAWFEGQKVIWGAIGTVALDGVAILDKVLQGDFKGAWDAAKGYGGEFIDGLTSRVQTGVDVLSGYLKSLAPADTLYAAWNDVPEYFSDTFATVHVFLFTRWQEIKTMIAAWPADFIKLGGDIVEGLKAGISAKWDGFKSWTDSKWQGLKTGFQKALGIQSPSKVFKKFGHNLMEGLVQGIAGSESQASDALSGVTSTLKAVMSSLSGDGAGVSVPSLSKIGGSFKDIASSIDTASDRAVKFFTGIVFGGAKAGAVVKRLIAQFAEKTFTHGLSSLFKGAFGGAGGGLLSLLFSANGNAFNNGNVLAFANGGVVNSPTAFPMRGGRMGIMGEAGPEAVMPLTRIGGKLGVRALPPSGRGGSEAVVRLELSPDLEGKIVATAVQTSARHTLKIVRGAGDAQNAALGGAIGEYDARGTSL